MGDNPRKFDEDFAATNRLRTEGTDNLLAAARAAGARRFVAQSFARLAVARDGGPVKTEADPLDPNRRDAFRRILEAIRHVEGRSPRPTASRRRAALRRLLRPRHVAGRGGAHLEAVRRRKFPIVGDGAGVWSFVHIEDAASATLGRDRARRAGHLQHRRRRAGAGPEWLPALAAAVGAPPPRHVPAWLGRPAGGEPASCS